MLILGLLSLHTPLTGIKEKINFLIDIYTGNSLQNDRPYKMTVHINHVAQVPFVVKTYPFYYMKEKALINTSQGMIMT